MSRIPTVRAEGLEFLQEVYGEGEHRVPISEVHARWLAWREGAGLPPAATNQRTFRQMLDRLEDLGEIRQLREGAAITGIEVLAASDGAGLGERLRHLERERALLWGRAIAVSPDAGQDLWNMPTPALNAYVRKRAASMAARQALRAQGIDPSAVPDMIEPLGEEGLAIKERVLRLEKELILRGGDLSFLAVPEGTRRRGTRRHA